MERVFCRRFLLSEAKFLFDLLQGVVAGFDHLCAHEYESADADNSINNKQGRFHAAKHHGEGEGNEKICQPVEKRAESHADTPYFYRKYFVQHDPADAEKDKCKRPAKKSFKRQGFRIGGVHEGILSFYESIAAPDAYYFVSGTGPKY